MNEFLALAALLAEEYTKRRAAEEQLATAQRRISELEAEAVKAGEAKKEAKKPI